MSKSVGLLKDRTVLVTGAGRGLGRAIALALAAEGADLVLTARNVASLATVQREIARLGARSTPCALELNSSAAAIEEFAAVVWEQTGGIDVLFNNAGLTFYKPCLETTEAQWFEVLNTNLSGVFWCCQSFGRRMLEHGAGKIINLASDIGMRGEANWSAYSASKGALIALSKSLAWEWAPRISVNIIAPGPFYTDANRAMFDQPDIRAAVEARIPLGKIGDPETHLGPLALLLAGPGSDYMTGAIFRVDGGICRS